MNACRPASPSNQLNARLAKLRSEVVDHHNQVKVLLGEIAVWEMTVLKPLQSCQASGTFGR